VHADCASSRVAGGHRAFELARSTPYAASSDASSAMNGSRPDSTRPLVLASPTHRRSPSALKMSSSTPRRGVVSARARSRARAVDPKARTRHARQERRVHRRAREIGGGPRPSCSSRPVRYAQTSCAGRGSARGGNDHTRTSRPRRRPNTTPLGGSACTSGRAPGAGRPAPRRSAWGRVPRACSSAPRSTPPRSRAGTAACPMRRLGPG
jgi:hypothetical protein